MSAETLRHLIEQLEKPKPQVSKMLVEKQLAEHAGRLAVVRQKLEEASNHYKKFLISLYDQALDHAQKKDYRAILEIQKAAEQANEEIVSMLKDILEFLDQMRVNVDLERHVLEKLDTVLDKAK